MHQFNGAKIGLPSDLEITVMYHPPEQGITLAGDLMQRIGPSMVELFTSAPSDASQAEAMRSARVDALKGLYKIIPGNELLPLAKRVLEHTTVTKGGKLLSLGTAGDFAQFFAGGNYKPLIPLMGKVIELNNFLDVDVSQLVLKAPEGQESASQETSVPNSSPS